MKKHTKLSISCIHVAEGKAKEYTIIKGEPFDKRDSGKDYLCKKCFDNIGKTIKKNDISKMITVCEDCIKLATKDKIFVKNNIK